MTNQLIYVVVVNVVPSTNVLLFKRLVYTSRLIYIADIVCCDKISLL